MAGLIAYSFSLTGALFFDDRQNLVNNGLLQIDGSRFDDWRVAALSSGAGITRRPVAMLTFAINHAVFGDISPAHLKAVNLLIHIAISLLVYAFATSVLASPALNELDIGDRRLWSVVAAAIWFLHPLQVSTVLYAVQRMAQLSTLFVVAGLLVFTRYRLRWALQGASSGEVASAVLWIAMLWLLAIFSKENGVLLPWLIVVTEVSLFQGIWRKQTSLGLLRVGWFALFLPLMGLGLVLALSPDIVVGGYSYREFSLEERLLTQARILWQYLSWLLLPDIRAMGFQHDDVVLSKSLLNPITTLLAVFSWVALLWASWRYRHAYPLVFFAVLFYLVAHSLESSMFPLEMVYEHRNYLPSVAVVVFVAAVFGLMTRQISVLRPEFLVIGVLSVLAILLGLRTYAWSDELLRSRVNVENHPMSPRAHFFYANATFQQYRDGEKLGYSLEEQKKLAVRSHYHFERMYDIDSTSLTAVVMLHQLESELFSQMPGRPDRLKTLSDLLELKRLQSSDYSALGSLVQYYSRDLGRNGRRRFGLMLEDLVELFPNNAEFLVLKYEFYAADTEISPIDRLAILEQVAVANPHRMQVYAYMIAENRKLGDWAGIHKATLRWMEADQSRRHLRALRQVFNR
ncbi:MAG: hypothetical protein ABJN62_03580 [Halioglobus sp.]